ncbi:MAG: hypothetical protein II007_11015 [Gammaproteobacteria bacterium]|nr:hypothetical protein [Gammaproteobacteria bacterium]
MVNLKHGVGLIACLVSALAVAEPLDSPGCKKGQAEYVALDYGQAAEIWAPLADAGDACAQHWLGMLYRDGNGVEMDKDAALALIHPLI